VPRAKGADVADDALGMAGVGRFGWVTDQEGNRIKLWQPACTAAAAPGHARGSEGRKPDATTGVPMVLSVWRREYCLRSAPWGRASATVDVMRSCRAAWSARHPVKVEVAGSNPVRTAGYSVWIHWVSSQVR
jgi:hypothetical protein